VLHADVKQADVFACTAELAVVHREDTSIVAAIRIGISTDLDFEYRATDPRGSALPDQPEDLFHCPGLLPDARLTLIVSQPV
jgi:hypothetical protein